MTTADLRPMGAHLQSGAVVLWAERLGRSIPGKVLVAGAAIPFFWDGFGEPALRAKATWRRTAGRSDRRIALRSRSRRVRRAERRQPFRWRSTTSLVCTHTG
jgi:hypothetical protein